MLQRLSFVYLTTVLLLSSSSQSFASLLNEENPTITQQSQVKKEHFLKNKNVLQITSLNGSFGYEESDLTSERSRGGRRAGTRSSAGKARLFKRGG